MTIGHRIRAARNLRGWSLRKLASVSGCDSSTICAIELGEIEPGAFKLMRVANALGMTASQALGELPMDEMECAVIAAIRNCKGNGK